MIHQDIILVPCGHFEKRFLETIARRVGFEFNCPVNTVEVRIELGDAYDPGRRQYNADKLLKALSSLVLANNSSKIIGLFDVDLFIPILTYIFGQAQLSGRYAIASAYRLKNERYGMKSDDVLLQERFIKEVIHELGHTMGLVHCYNPVCVMRSGTYLEDIDQKGSTRCYACRKITQVL
ncbi:MAG TPA: hypothetical protein DCR43_02845 [Bacteroidales bacterium]|nr:MAG: hypothetical protein A2X11_08985 [Bacteroidetes bacterium GWE2_42_24]OFY26157.1 MAG: hypothetical protein A2X09_13580 [Bacteroidetes bacterium GWF2_43_11]HAQ64781.1 hypothetical protein [Bacteroidales bacterium]HBZ67848.1 hypothetical protein [Bacteroidales bacterium]